LHLYFINLFNLLKKSNLLLKDQRIKIADFGDCIRVDSFSISTQCGTREYFSPELEANKQHDFKTDVWSVGCVIFELISLKTYKQWCLNPNQEAMLNLPNILIKLIKMY
jgi:serine/threonine protein kinase